MLIRTFTFAFLVLSAALPSQQRPAPPAPPQPKVFNLPANSSGDCRMLSGKVTIYPDGTGTFQATTLTYHTHSGDYWHIQMTGRSRGNTVLFGTPIFTGPRMNDGNPPPQYNWQDRFLFDRSVFNDVADFHADSHC